MKRIAAIGLAVILMLIPFMAVNCDSNGDGGNGDTAAIKDVIRDMYDAYNQENFAKALTYCTNYGDEDEAIAQMAAMKNITGNITVKSIDNINIDGSTATASVTEQVWGEDDTYEMKLVKIDGNWKVDMEEGDGDGGNGDLLWSEMNSGTSNNLEGIWGSSSITSEVYDQGL